MATSPRSPTDTSGLDQFEIGEGISPGGNPELLDALIDLGDESSPRGPGLAPPHTVTSDAMELSALVLDPGARQHSLQDLDLDLTPKSPSKVQIVLDLEMAEGECKKFPQEPSLADALLVLNSVHAGNALSLEIKPSASPIADVGSQCYVMDRSRKRGARAQRPEGASFTVTFQSAHNSEIYFPDAKADIGVSARPMGRTTKKSGTSVPHGYRGKLYTLVRRAGENDRRSVNVVDENLGLVRVWRIADEEHDASSLSSSNAPAKPRRRKRARAATHVSDDVSGDLRVHGDLFVEGYVHGRLVTPEGAADYAEWLPRRAGETQAVPGTVVRLADDATWTRNTRGPGPCLVVSTSPSLAAGVPSDRKVEEGAALAFMGQVPVRCVGPVAAGDQLYPSGRGDGLAVAQPHAKDEAQQLGIAMEDSDNGAEEHTVLAFVRWQAHVRREVSQEMHGSLLSMLRMMLSSLAIAVIVVAFLATLCHIDVFGFHQIITTVPFITVYAVLLYLNVLQACMTLALLATFQENAPVKIVFGLILLATFVLACVDWADGSRAPCNAKALTIAWCVLSTVFHFACAYTAGYVLVKQVRAPIEDGKRDVDYAAFEDGTAREKAEKVARYRRIADRVAVAAAILAFLWFVLAPAPIAVAVVNHNLSRRIDNLDDEMAAAVNGTHHSDNDDGWDGWPMM